MQVLASRDCARRHHSAEALGRGSCPKKDELVQRLHAKGVGAWTAAQHGTSQGLDAAVRSVVGHEVAREGLSSDLHRALLRDVHSRAT